jgi:hypothetical protein
VAVVIVLASIAIIEITDMRPQYDAFGWLVWGRQTLHWSLNTDGAPSWKPLTFGFTLPYALAGRAQLWLWMVTAVAAALSGAAFAGRIAYRLTGPSAGRRYAPVAAGLFAGFGVLGIDRYWHFILIANSDPMIVALCLGAIDCQLSGRLRWAFALLVLAALGRPELWPFVGLYGLWAWRAAPAMRMLVAVGVLVIPLLWFGVPALTAKSWLVAGNLAENSANALHGDKISGVIGRLLHLYEWPMLLAVLAGIVLAARARDRRLLLLAGAASIWVVVEIAFALHGWSAVPRYLFEPAAVLIVIGGVGVGRLLAAGALSSRIAAWAGPLLVVVLVAALLPAARSRLRFVHGEASYARLYGRQLDRLRDVIARDGGGAHILSCGQPVSVLQFQSVLAWEIGENVGNVGYKVPKSIRSGRPIVIFKPRGWGWEVQPIHLRATDRDRCADLAARTDFS